MAIGVVLIALALLAILAMSIAVSSRDSSNALSVERLKQQLLGQGYLIRQKILQCAQDYPNGNNGDANAFDPAFPAQSDHAVQDLTCAGAPGTPSLWTGTDGVFYPAAIPGCNAWHYYNDKTRAGTPALEFELMCTAKDGITALSLMAAQIGADASFYSNTTPNDTLMWQLHN